MNIAEGAMVSVYSDAMAFLLVFGLMLLPDRRYRRKETEAKLFMAICINILLVAFFGGICYALRGQSWEWMPLAELISKTVVELALINIVYQWVVYVDYKLYKSRDQLRRRYRGLYLPVLILMIALIVNLFTGILFTIRPDGGYDSTLMYDVLMAVEYIYILISVLLIIQYDRAHPGRRSFSIIPALVPMVLGSVVSVFTSYSATALGIAVGMVLLYFSMINGWRFEDSESGYYNRALLTELINSDSPLVDVIHGAIFFETSGDAGKLGALLKREMPPMSVIVHESEKRFVLLTRSGQQGDLGFLADLVSDASEEYEGGAVSLKTKCESRKKEEDAKAFLRRTVMAD